MKMKFKLNLQAKLKSFREKFITPWSLWLVFLGAMLFAALIAGLSEIGRAHV
jgi:hypothetical protein